MGASTSFSASTESKERMSTKYANARTIFAVACGLAVCCSVMYITADGEQLETVHAAAAPVFNSPGPKSVQSTDVQKAATIFTNTPDGRMRLRTLPMPPASCTVNFPAFSWPSLSQTASSSGGSGLTDVIKSRKAAAKKDRALISQQTKGIQADLNK